MTKKRIQPIAILLAASMAATASAEVPESAFVGLLKVLRDRGSITAAEYEALRQAAQSDAHPSTTAAKPSVPTTAATASPAAPAPAPGATATPAGATPAPGAPKAPALAGTDAAKAPAKATPKWYDRLSFRGYVQMRYHSIYNQPDDVRLSIPNDRGVSTTESFMIRRARLILSGDLSDHVSLYFQPDFNALPGDGQYSAQLRDVYADISFDQAKEYRVRVGQSKVPYGFVNMQSSQNRVAIERPDAINSAVEGERDIGAFFYWAPSEIRDRFKHLVSSGLKGSGDYGVAALGVYSGQGLNRSDRNGDLHVVGRLSYPWELPNKQVFEAGVQAYTGRFVVDADTIPDPLNPKATVKPTVRADGLADERVGLTAVWYPQPFGFEAEWNWGRGPQLSADRRTIGVDSLEGGYAQLNYRKESPAGVWIPFTRWQYYDGGRKFAKNAPRALVNEVDFGVEYAPWKELELTVAYTHTFHRTNTGTAPYGDAAGADRVSVQVQWNF